MRRSLIIGLGVVAAAAAGAVWWRYAPPQPARAPAEQARPRPDGQRPDGPRSDGQRPVPVVTATIGRKDLPVYLDGLGTVQASSTVTVRKLYPEVDLQDVLTAFAEVLRRADRSTHHRIEREPLSVRERMSSVLSRLKDKPLLAFSELFNRREGRQGALVSLLAILELCKERFIEIIQEEPLGELFIRVHQLVPS